MEYVYKVKVLYKLTTYNMHLSDREYIILERIKQEEFYKKKYYPETISVLPWDDNDCGDYEIDGYDYYDFNKPNLRSIDLYQSVYRFNIIQNRIESIEEVLN